MKWEITLARLATDAVTISVAIHCDTFKAKVLNNNYKEREKERKRKRKREREGERQREKEKRERERERERTSKNWSTECENYFLKAFSECCNVR
jgi:DNA anti-recombination protein RmuC